MNSRKFLMKITDKWPVKVLSVIAALVLSVFHRVNTLETRFFSAPLRIVSDSKLVPAGSYAHTVRISVRGEANDIGSILEDDIEAFIDLDRYKSEGSYKIPVQTRKKGSALGVEPLEISVVPMEINVALEEKISRKISVSPVFRGNVAQGYELTSQFVNPTAVTADGPRGAMEALYEFYTGVIDLDGRYEDFSVMVNIINDNPLIIIHGNRMLECRGAIRRIPRQSQRYESASGSENE